MGPSTHRSCYSPTQRCSGPCRLPGNRRITCRRSLLDGRTSCRKSYPFIPLAGVGELESRGLLGNSSCSLLHVTIEAVLPGTRVPALFPCDSSVRRLTVPGPATVPADSAQQRRQPLQ